MNWVLASVLMLIFSNIYYLIVRLGQLRGIGVKHSMVANFSIPPLLYFFMGLGTSASFHITLTTFIVICITAVVFSYFGSVIAYLATQSSPNAGYSLVIQKSYGVYTSVAAIFLFGSSLQPIKFLYILLVVLCTAVVIGVFEKKHTIKQDTRWIIYSILAFFCFGSLRLAGKWVVSVAGVDQFAYQTWLLTLVALISIIDLWIHRRQEIFPNNKINWFILLGTGTMVTLFYYFLLAAEVAAPNIGYVGAINTGSNAIFTLLAAKFLGDKLSLPRFLGVLGVTVGIILLVL